MSLLKETNMAKVGMRQEGSNTTSKNISLAGLCVAIGMTIGTLSISLSQENMNDNNEQYHSIRISGKDTKDQGLPHTLSWPNWPAVAYEEVGHPLVSKGNSFFDKAREHYFQEQANGKTLMNEFIQAYKNRPDPVNMCGIRINHALALFLAVKKVQPSLVVESGVNAGVSTYIIRAASETTKIFAIDPEEKPICNQGDRWIDTSNKTINYTGENFVDILELDWKGMVKRKEVDPDRTLVFIDDHLHTFNRIAAIMKVGIRHILVEDNYKIHEGATMNDKISTPKQMFGGQKWKMEGNWLLNNLVSYAEFPPIIPPIMSEASSEPRKKAGGFMVAADDNTDIVAPMLRPDLSEDDMRVYTDISKAFNIDPTLQDRDSYMQFMNYNQICHLEVIAVPHSLLYE